MKKIEGNRKLNVILAVGTALLLLAMKQFFSTSNVEDLKFILSPTSKLVGLVTGNTFVFVAKEGYAKGGIIIDKSCSGINFLILTFSLSAFLIITHVEHIGRKVVLLAASLAGCYLLTIAVNSFRITGAILMLKVSPVGSFLSTNLAHHAQGVVVYFTFLLIYYFGLNRYLSGRKVASVKI